MQPFSFAQFMREGGWGMWPVLALGLVALASAIGSCVRAGRLSLRFVGLLWLTLATAVAHAVATDLVAVFRSAADPAWAADLARVLLIGLKESSRPAALGGIFLTLVPLIAAVGVYRQSSAKPTAVS